MKRIYNTLLLLLVVMATSGVYTSCSEEDLVNNGEPQVRYVRITKPESSDSLLVAAFQGSVVAIMGDNLQGVVEIWFNDRQAALSPTYITSTTIITNVPSQIPTVITNTMKLVFANGSTLEYPFKLQVSEPEINSMKSEYVLAGAVATIRGDFFYEPLTVTFTGGVTGEVVKVEDKVIEVIVPEGAESGPITVTTNFGETVSTLHFRDTRFFLNYDDLNASGSWRSGTLATTDAMDANYLLLKGILNKNQRTEDFPGGGFVSEFWAMSNGRPEGNLLPGAPADYVLKFEANVVDWYGSYLNICFAPWDHANANNEYWTNELNARAIWGPWDSGTTSYKSKGWITVVVPMIDFKYKIDSDTDGNVVYNSMDFDPAVTGSLTFWMVGSKYASSSGSPVDIHIDNVRIVPK